MYLLLEPEIVTQAQIKAPCGVMVKAMDCRIVVSEFELQSCYYVHFQTNTLGKDMNLLILQAIGQIIPLLFFSKDGIGIKWPTKVDMPLKQRNQNQTNGSLIIIDV